MKCFAFIFVVMLVGLSTAAVTGGHGRGCRYISGRCYEDCPVGTHSYTTGCSHLIPEATCEEPNPVQERGIICDYSSCHCDPPTVRHKDKCIPLEECPKKVPPKSETESHVDQILIEEKYETKA